MLKKDRFSSNFNLNGCMLQTDVEKAGVYSSRDGIWYKKAHSDERVGNDLNIRMIGILMICVVLVDMHLMMIVVWARMTTDRLLIR